MQPITPPAAPAVPATVALRTLAAVLSAALSLPLLGGCAAFEAIGVDPLGPQPLAGAARSAVKGRGNVFAWLEPDGTAIVRGWVDDRISEQAVLNTVAAYPGVDRVIDRVEVEDWFR